MESRIVQAWSLINGVPRPVNASVNDRRVPEPLRDADRSLGEFVVGANRQHDLVGGDDGGDEVRVVGLSAWVCELGLAPSRPHQAPRSR